MSITTIFVTALLMGFSGAVMPGPLLTVNIHESYQRGFWTGPLLILGHGILELFLLIGLILGLDSILKTPIFQNSIAIIGGAVLLWMAWGMLKDSWQGNLSLDLEDSEQKARSLNPIIAGIVVSLSNPYWSLWWATIGLTYVSQALQKGFLALAAFYIGHIMADLIWYSGISFAVVSGKKILSDNIYRIIIMTCGLFLVFLALYFIWSARGLIYN